MKCIILFACLVIGAKAKPFFEGERPLNVGRRGRLGVGMGGRNFRRGMDQSGVEYGIPDESGFIPGSYETGMSPGMGFDNGMGPEGIVFDDGIGPQTGMGYEPGMGIFANGQEYGGQEFNNGASGFGNQAIRNAGGKHYHNIGARHRKVSSINQEENDESHNIGSDSGFNTGAQSNGGFRNYKNGGSRYGNQYGQGSEGIVF